MLGFMMGYQAPTPYERAKLNGRNSWVRTMQLPGWSGPLDLPQSSPVKQWQMLYKVRPQKNEAATCRYTFNDR